MEIEFVGKSRVIWIRDQQTRFDPTQRQEEFAVVSESSGVEVGLVASSKCTLCGRR